MEIRGSIVKCVKCFVCHNWDVHAVKNADALSESINSEIAITAALLCYNLYLFIINLLFLPCRGELIHFPA